MGLFSVLAFIIFQLASALGRNMLCKFWVAKRSCRQLCNCFGELSQVGSIDFAPRRPWGFFGVLLGFMALSSLFCFACSLLDFLVCCSGHSPCGCWFFCSVIFVLMMYQHPFIAWISNGYGCMKRVPARMFLLCMLLRVGEASHPGPKRWTLGVCNPAGLNHKAHLFQNDTVDTWLISESHLSSQGHKEFVKGLRFHQTPYRWSVTGAHVQPRSTVSSHGQWSGVMVLSSCPTRRVAHSWPQPLQDTSRLVASTTFCAGLWLNGVVVYCPPTGPTHPGAKQSANGLLAAAVDQLRLMDGPRYLAGDFNHDIDDLEALQQLHSMHFVEVQSLRCTLTGQLPQATCKQKTRRDFLYISADLVPLFRSVEVDDTRWIDHATIVATFEGSHEDTIRFPWPLPASIDWSAFRSSSGNMSFPATAGSDASESYRLFWQAVEQEAQKVASSKHQPLPKKCFGRAVRRAPLKVKGSIDPVRCGRNGELQPQFFGLSFAHKHHFRQLRRLQSYRRLSHAVVKTQSHVEHQASLWHSILKAPGFFPHFAAWWDSTFPAVAVCVPSGPPGSAVADMLFDHFVPHVRQLESALRSQHRGSPDSSKTAPLASLYRAVKRDAPAQVDVLFETRSATVMALDNEFQAVELDQEVVWDETRPVIINQVQRQPIVFSPDKLWLESLQDVSVGDAVLQPKRIGKLEHVFQAFIEYWSSMWSAHANVPASQWEQIMDFTATRIGRVELPPAPMHAAILRATAKSKKHTAATGLDGVSRHDVVSLTSNQLEHLRGIYVHAHSSGEWPSQMLDGVVKSLAKTADPSGVTNYRPITVFSFCYRLWSSLQSRYWLAGLEPILDRMLYGNRQGLQAASLWRQVLELVEEAQAAHTQLAGLVLDLTKAYNLLPRLPCLGLALRCGVDYGTVCAWAAALNQLQRRFWVDGSVSGGVRSNRGFPEGCGLSCLAMLVLNQAWHCWIKEANMLFRPLSYVDNWEILCCDPQLIRQAFEATVSFTNALDLRIDSQKTFTWAVLPEDRSLLRQQGFQVQNCCRDLGAQMVFSRQIRNSVAQERFDSLLPFWTKLRKTKGGYLDKLRIVRTAAWPRALHGISAAYIGKKKFHRLRTGMMQALGVDKPGANAYLQCFVEDALDPQLLSILHSIREWRTIGNHAHQLAQLSTLSDQPDFAPASLTGILVQRLQVLGWPLDHHGVVHDQYGSFDLVATNWTEVMARVNSAWLGVVHSQVHCRPDFQFFSRVDVRATRKRLLSLDSYERAIVHHQLIGVTVTNEHACHWSTDGSSECIACGQPDSLFHRYWACAATADLRRHLTWDILQLIPVLPKVLTCHGWSLASEFQAEWYRYLLSLTQSVPQVECPSTTPWIDLFTDGSCFFPTEEAYRVSAWAVCFAPMPSIQFSSADITVLASAPLGGLVQTAFRSELFAVVVSLSWAVLWNKSVRIWTDCQSVIDRCYLIGVGGFRVHQCSANNDLWNEVARLIHELGPDRVRFVKVSAHEEWSSETEEVVRWAQIGNACVDHAARMANNDRGVAAWDLWTRHSQLVYKHSVVAAEIQRHHLLVSQRWTEEYSNTVPRLPTTKPPREAKQKPMFCLGLSTPLDSPGTVVKSWGLEFAELFRAWWRNLFELDHSVVSWTSFAQLYIDFQLQCKHPGLVKFQRGWLDPQNLPGTMPENHPFRRRCKWFRLLVQQWLKATGVEVSKAVTRPSSLLLCCHIGCIALPAKQSRLEHVEDWLRGCIRVPISGLGSGLDAIPPAW